MNDLHLFFEALVRYYLYHGKPYTEPRRLRYEAALQFWTFAQRKAELATRIDAAEDIRDALYWLPETITIEDKGHLLVVRENGEYRGVVHRGDADHRGQQWIVWDSVYIHLSAAVSVVLGARWGTA